MRFSYEQHVKRSRIEMDLHPRHPLHHVLHLYIKLEMGATTFGSQMQLQAIQEQRGVKI